MKYIFGNWKANKTLPEVIEWIEFYKKEYQPHKEIVVGIAPPAPFLSYIHHELQQCTNTWVGAQTLASIEKGSYTGETTANSLAGVVEFAIIGHSERRKHFGETDEDLLKKVEQSLAHGIIPVYCVRDAQDPIPDGVRFVAYEPVAAIGTGQNEPPAETIAMKKKMNLPTDCIFIYGGSVNETNAAGYLATGEIDGFLIGKASLEVAQFFNIIQAVK